MLAVLQFSLLVVKTNWTMNNKPTPKPAVIYNQDALYDFASGGGSVESLLGEELQDGNRVIVVQEPTNAPAAV